MLCLNFAQNAKLYCLAVNPLDHTDYNLHYFPFCNCFDNQCLACFLLPFYIHTSCLVYLAPVLFTFVIFFHSIFLLVLNSSSTFLLQEVYEQQKEIILLGERAVLATLGFDLNLLHPYKPLVDAIKKFKVAQNALAQVAWNFVNDGYGKLLILVYIPFFSVSS